MSMSINVLVDIPDDSSSEEEADERRRSTPLVRTGANCPSCLLPDMHMILCTATSNV
jgi:hypothetical protein